MLKKATTTFLILLVLMFLPINSYAYFDKGSNKNSAVKPYIPPEKSKEELYQDILMTLLLPYIQNEVDKFYKEYLTDPPGVAPYGIYILEAYRINYYRGFDFRLKLELHPYVGSHLSVGTDYITLRVKPGENVIIEKFEHIRSYELPPYYQNIIKKKLP